MRKSKFYHHLAKLRKFPELTQSTALCFTGTDLPTGALFLFDRVVLCQCLLYRVP